jgi:hypothetical protein
LVDHVSFDNTNHFVCYLAVFVDEDKCWNRYNSVFIGKGSVVFTVNIIELKWDFTLVIGFRLLDQRRNLFTSRSPGCMEKQDFRPRPRR